MTLIRILREIRPVLTDKICLQIQEGEVRSHLCGDYETVEYRHGWLSNTKIPVVNWDEFTEQAPIFNYSLKDGTINYATRDVWESL